MKLTAALHYLTKQLQHLKKPAPEQVSKLLGASPALKDLFEGRTTVPPGRLLGTAPTLDQQSQTLLAKAYGELRGDAKETFVKASNELAEAVTREAEGRSPRGGERVEKAIEQALVVWNALGGGASRSPLDQAQGVRAMAADGLQRKLYEQARKHQATQRRLKTLKRRRKGLQDVLDDWPDEDERRSYTYIEENEEGEEQTVTKTLTRAEAEALAASMDASVLNLEAESERWRLALLAAQESKHAALRLLPELLRGVQASFEHLLPGAAI